MKRTNLLALWKLNKTSKAPFIGTSDFLATLPFMDEYLQNFTRIDRNFIVTKGFFNPVWNRNYESTDQAVLDQFKEDVDDLLFRNKNNYQHMYDVLLTEYNPIENYDRNETVKDITDTSNKTTNDYGETMEHFDYGKSSSQDVTGSQEMTDNLGKTKQTDNNGAVKITDNMGQTHTTDSIGTQTDTNNYAAVTTSHSRAGFNSNSYEPESRDIADGHIDTISHGGQSNSHISDAVVNEHTTDKVTNTSETDAVTNTTTAGERTDKHTVDARSDLHNTEARQDVSNLSGTEIYDHTSRIHGNIGVTTSQQMIESEMQLRAKYNIYKIIYEDIIKELCVYVDEGVDAFRAGLCNDDDFADIGGDSLNNVSLTVEQLEHGIRVTATDSHGTTTGIVNDGTTPRIKVEDDGDMYVNYDKEDE